MNSAIDELLRSAGAPLSPNSVERLDWLAKFGRVVGAELEALLTAKNGFYAFESALLVRSSHDLELPLGLRKWNSYSLWRGHYQSDLAGAFFFAEDIFGYQFCISNERVRRFDPETGQFKEEWESLSKWAEGVGRDRDYLTGYPLAHSWQIQNGALRVGFRLLPKVPFVCGGAFESANLYEIEDVDGMKLRASIANQLRDVPDGAQIVLKVQRHCR